MECVQIEIIFGQGVLLMDQAMTFLYTQNLKSQTNWLVYMNPQLTMAHHLSSFQTNAIQNKNRQSTKTSLCFLQARKTHGRHKT